MPDKSTSDEQPAEKAADATRRERRERRERSGRSQGSKPKFNAMSLIGIGGEVLITVGVLILGYILWQPWYTSTIVTEKQVEISDAIVEDWRPSAAPTTTAPSSAPSLEGMPALSKAPDYEVFAIMHVPAFSPKFSNVIAETTDLPKVLNLDEKGVGHYDLTQQLGQPGNFALAGHRSGPLINSFREIMNLRVGDPIFIETKEGWYTYRFRDIEYVWPQNVDVLNPFPRLQGTPGTDYILTMTTCHPKLDGNAERAIAYAVLEDYSPAAEGEPAELTKLKAKKKA